MNTEHLFAKMIEYYSGDPKRIQHFVKVHSFAMRIGLAEHLDEKTLGILETAAIVHDIGIKVSVEKYGSSDGKYQEAEGPAIAKAMLEGLQYPQEIVDRVCYLVGHHHTYTKIDGADYQILIEADFLVNMFEDAMSRDSLCSVREKIFRTKTGKWLCETMYQD
jgi:HD superfamily phosphodiesterase